MLHVKEAHWGLLFIQRSQASLMNLREKALSESKSGRLHAGADQAVAEPMRLKLAESQCCVNPDKSLSESNCDVHARNTHEL